MEVDATLVFCPKRSWGHLSFLKLDSSSGLLNSAWLFNSSKLKIDLWFANTISFFSYPFFNFFYWFVITLEVQEAFLDCSPLSLSKSMPFLCPKLIHQCPAWRHSTLQFEPIKDHSIFILKRWLSPLFF